jgi:hypothetical protein
MREYDTLVKLKGLELEFVKTRIWTSEASIIRFAKVRDFIYRFRFSLRVLVRKLSQTSALLWSSVHMAAASQHRDRLNLALMSVSRS